VTDGDPVPDRDAGTNHEHAAAAHADASTANRYTSSANGHADAVYANANSANRYASAPNEHARASA